MAEAIQSSLVFSLEENTTPVIPRLISGFSTEVKGEWLLSMRLLSSEIFKVPSSDLPSASVYVVRKSNM